MRIPTIKRILKGDIPDSPDWFDKILSTLNQFMDAAITCFSGRITFTENMLCEIKELTFTHGVELLISHKLSLLGCLKIMSPYESGILTIATEAIRVIDNNTIGMTYTFTGGSSSTKGKIKIILIGK